jgi:hypothetical protein
MVVCTQRRKHGKKRTKIDEEMKKKKEPLFVVPVDRRQSLGSRLMLL